MRYFQYLLVSFLLLTPITANAQNPKACSSDGHRSFDFWLGNWEVVDKDDQKLGSNTITSREGGCMIHESWTGKNGFSGQSTNYYDPNSQQWNQLWLDTAGTILKLSGGMKNDAMLMRSESQTDSNGKVTYNEISWTPREDGSVVQKWVVRNAQDKISSTLFLGIYKQIGSN